jgi:purine catabolism regulator
VVSGAVRIGREVVGFVATVGEPDADPELRSWLEATAAAAGVTALIKESERHDAKLEAELLEALAEMPGVALAGHEETYRLLIRIAIRNPNELEQLRERTIAPVTVYDARHDTELVATLQAFLAHHGSTTETAEAMALHRHTVGYRLARVHEVSGLSPYESDGRERLSLGLKAHEILRALEQLPNSEHL